jgi:acyl dehydratase
MPLLSSAAGKIIGERIVEITPRMTMAYAAAIGAVDECYMDDLNPEGIVAPPPFCVTLEWPLLFDERCRVLTGTTNEESWGGIHVQQDTTFHRVIRPEDRLRTVARTVQVRATRSGALTVTKLDTTEVKSGAPVVTSWVSIIFRGLYVDGPNSSRAEPPSLRPDEELTLPAGHSVRIQLPRTLPHAYTECSGIWNPIHTERRVAKSKGLPDIILHGTCTWALAAVETIRHAGGDPARLRRFAGRFDAMVIPGTHIDISLAPSSPGGHFQFVVHNAEGNLAIANGVAELSVA